ncbi:MAG: LysE family translocator [Chloroflexi bacterium]|nr:LysE family translocator [Chloroflexota bacterium]
MDISILLRGIIIGFSIAAPVGPIGLLCIQRTLAHGRAQGLASGMGAASADAIYGLVAAFGLTFVSSRVIDAQVALRLIGGTYLCYLGLKTYRQQPAARPAATTERGQDLTRAYGSTLLLTLTNPMTILSFAAIFAGLGFGIVDGDYLGATLVVLGVFTGSALWWLILSSLAGLFRNRLDTRALRWLNRLSGLLVMGFGIFALASLLTQT